MDPAEESSVKPAPFDYLRVDSADEALEALHQAGGDARILAGGQSLMPILNMRLARPQVLVDIMHVREWQNIEDKGNALRIGPAVRQSALERGIDLVRRQPLLAAALPWVGHMQTRGRGTVCGSIAHADPSAELPLLLVALGGVVHLRAQKRRRDVAAADFFSGMMATARADDELIDGVSIPTTRLATGYAFREVARRHGDFAIVACAAIAGTGNVRLAVAGVADRPTALSLPSDPSGWDDALDAFAWTLEARDDLHATARYRRDLVRRIGRSVMEEAQRCRV
jgi:2-furoyl-CoA dehydrogenase FAD binding subunit